MQLNRKLTPELNSIDKIKIVEAEKICLSNGIDHYIINAGTQDVIKMDLIFEAGDEHHALKVVGQATNHLIDDGTKNKSAVQIASEIESIGASIECNCDIHNATITLYVLGKFFEPALKLIYELICEADFPENEVSIYAHRNKQQLLVNSEKVNFIAQQEFRKALFGSTHIYGRNQEGSDFDKIDRKSTRLNSSHVSESRMPSSA